MASRWALFPLAARLVLATTIVGVQNVLDFTPPKLHWQPCGQNVSCVNISVPLDWDQPHGKQIDLFVNKVSRYSDKKARVGSLILNPGGPGGSSHDYAVFGFADPKNSALGDHFDLIGVDVRGVGYSKEPRCEDNIRNETAFKWPKDQAEYDKLVDNNKRFAESCLKYTGDVIKHLDTVSVAKDIEAVRIALQDGKINFFGESYGTQIGTTYASLFPKSIRTLVMDGNLDHSTDMTSSFGAWAAGLEASFTHWTQWCDQSPDCSLQNRTLAGQNETSTRDIWLEILRRADKKTYNFTPNCAPSGCSNRTLDKNDIISFAYSSLYDPKNGWPQLSDALNKTLDGDISDLISEFEGFKDPDIHRPPYPTRYRFSLTTCLDWEIPKTLSGFQQLDLLGKTIAPLTQGRTLSYNFMQACAGWPFKIPDTLQRPLNVSAEVPPILIVQSTYDPTTPFQGAVNVQQQIPKSVLLTRDGDGHTSYLGGDKRLRDIVEAYIVNLTLPDAHVVIRSNSSGEGFGV